VREKKKIGSPATNQTKLPTPTHATLHERGHNVAFNYTIKRYFWMLDGITRVT